jgi:hypothetical protein
MRAAALALATVPARAARADKLRVGLRPVPPGRQRAAPGRARAGRHRDRDWHRELTGNLLGLWLGHWQPASGRAGWLSQAQPRSDATARAQPGRAHEARAADPSPTRSLSPVRPRDSPSYPQPRLSCGPGPGIGPAVRESSSHYPPGEAQPEPKQHPAGSAAARAPGPLTRSSLILNRRYIAAGGGCQ